MSIPPGLDAQSEKTCMGIVLSLVFFMADLSVDIDSVKGETALFATIPLSEEQRSETTTVICGHRHHLFSIAKRLTMWRTKARAIDAVRQNREYLRR